MGPLESGRLATRNFQSTGDWIDRVVFAIRFLPSVAGIAFHPNILAIALVASLILQGFSLSLSAPPQQKTPGSLSLESRQKLPLIPARNLPQSITEAAVYREDITKLQNNATPQDTSNFLAWNAFEITFPPLAYPLLWPDPSSWLAWVGVFLNWGISGFTGLMIARSTSRTLALREVGFIPLLQEAARGWWTLFGAISLLLLTYFACQLGLSGLAVMTRIPVAGATISALESPLTIAVSLIAGGVLLLVAYAWPILATCWAADDCDGFGAISRSVSYLTTGFFPAVLMGLLAVIIAWIVLFCIQFLLSSAMTAGTAWATPATATGVSTTWEQTLSFGLLIVNNAIFLAVFWTVLTGWTLSIRQFVDAMPADSPEVFDRGLKPRETYPVVGLAAVAPQLASGDLPMEQKPLSTDENA
ncbi:hypothetical protein Plim_2258 [Planctopirus limnophila DSM 3776]|uniref:Uncharacterized protein n=1 Tax=Planctopirus limnophila (strain ATCC 43296 / DSM 3776 / IFAM 1008 / Mu 290) TaxID=521674 RepID=D5SNH0_PLAL2|nr:hypothetical protein Plim_2258 [Planctopirus limnophila DSM 3776]